MALNFPASPTEGQTYAAEGATYIYKNGRWVVLSNADMSGYVAKAGDTMSGSLLIENLAPAMRWHETDAPAGEGYWQAYAFGAGAQFAFTRTDAAGVGVGTYIMRFLAPAAGEPERIAIDAPIVSHVKIRNTGPALMLEESDQVAPAGMYRHYLYAGDYFFQRANDADWGGATSIWTYTAATPLLTVPSMAQIGTVHINRSPLGTSVNNRISSTGSTAIQSFDSSTFVTMYNGSGTVNGRFDNAGVAAPAQTYSVVTREKGDARYTAISSRRYKRNIALQPLDALTHVFDHLVPHRWTWGGDVPRGDERLGRRGIGFIAEEVHELLPAASIMRRVPIDIPLDENGEQDATASSYSKDMRVDGLDPIALCAVLFAKIKQLEERLEAVEATG